MIVLQDSMLQVLKSNIRSGLEGYMENSIWCAEFLGIEESTLVVPINLTFGEGKKSDYDLEHSIKIHQTLGQIPIYLANNEKYWTFHTHVTFWNYMRERWPIEDAQKNKENFILNRYFFGPATIYRNGLARLWWYAYITFDSDLEDPYFYTRILLRTQDIAGYVAQTGNIARNKKVLKASLNVISILLDMEEQNIIKLKDREQFIRNIFKHANSLSSVRVLEFLDLVELQEELYSYCVNQINSEEFWLTKINV